MKLPALCFLVLLCGCTAFRLESPALLQGQVDAVAYRGRDEGRKEGRKVSVAGLPELLARATWVDGHVAHKGGLWVRFAEGREVFLPYGFDIFFMGERGYFEIRQEDVPAYRAIVERIQKESNQAPNP